MTPPSDIAATLMVLMDGAAATALVDDNPGAARAARWAVERLIDAVPRASDNPHAR